MIRHDAREMPGHYPLHCKLSAELSDATNLPEMATYHGCLGRCPRHCQSHCRARLRWKWPEVPSWRWFEQHEQRHSLPRYQARTRRIVSSITFARSDRARFHPVRHWTRSSYQTLASPFASQEGSGGGRCSSVRLSCS